jgi:hypothetical protein
MSIRFADVPVDAHARSLSADGPRGAGGQPMLKPSNSHGEDVLCYQHEELIQVEQLAEKAFGLDLCRPLPRRPASRAAVRTMMGTCGPGSSRYARANSQPSMTAIRMSSRITLGWVGR